MGNYAYKSSAFCHVEQEKTRDFRKGKQKDEYAEGRSVVPWGASGVVGCEVWTKTGRSPESVTNVRPAVLGAGQGVGECGARTTRSVRKNAPFDRGMVEGRVWMRRNAESVVRAEAGIIACLWRF